MKATNINKMNSRGHNPSEWEDIPEIKACRPKKGYVEVSLQRLVTHKSVILVQWMGAKSGVWWPASDIFMITKK